MPTFAETKAGYHNLWSKCQIATGQEKAAAWVAQQIIANKTIYQSIEVQTKVPWFLIGVLHERESGMDFKTYLGNGDPLDKPTVRVPRGRGPFASFAAGAVDALRYDKLAGVTAWSIELCLYCAEEFNGEGYELHHDENSPYVWAGTNLQQPGKYTADGQFDPTAWDTQLGVAAILKSLCSLDKSVAAFCSTSQTQPKEPDVTATPNVIPGLDFQTLEPIIEQILPAIGNMVPPQYKPFFDVGVLIARTLLHAKPPTA